MFAHQPSDAAAERQPGNARVRDGPAGGSEAVDLSLTVELTPDNAAFRAGRARDWIDADALHQRQVDHDSAVAGAVAGGVVRTPAHRDKEVLRTREVHGFLDIRHAGTARDEPRPPIDVAVPNAARRLIAVVAGKEYGPFSTRPQARKIVGAQLRHGAVEGEHTCVGHRSFLP